MVPYIDVAGVEWYSRRHIMRSILLIFFIWVLLAALPVQSSERPTLGLALGGGGARGIAHIGLLQWLEDHRVPVDFIAGASMGGLVGGAWLEAGSAFDAWSDAAHQWNASGGFVLETFLGPFFIGGSVSLTNGDGRFYVNLGPFVR